MRPGRFEGRRVLVTGASRGLGSVVARAFASEGAHVGLTFRSRKADAEAILASIEGAGGSGSLYALDVRDRGRFEAVVREFGQAGPLDVLVNNAAVVEDHPFAMMASSAWERVLATNLTGTFNGCRSAAAIMLEHGGGTIVNVTSVAGARGSPGQANYAASKGGVIALTRTLAVELARFGIRVNAVMPGLLDTGMGARLDHRVAGARIEQVPAGRAGTAQEVAAAILFLASDEASYVFGQVLVVDGGLTA
jgi:3-oxoacyl-[acyl-carrier protein] reductase